MSISGQVKELREYVSTYETQPFGREVKGTVRVLSEAADTIEELSAKLAANMGRSEDYNRLNEVLKDIDTEIDNVIVKDTYSKGKNAGLRKAKIFIQEKIEKTVGEVL